MRSFILMLLLGLGENQALFLQSLTCSHEPQQQNLVRVWCRQSSAACCTGLAFSNTSSSADGGKLRVIQGESSFTVEVLEPSQREGVYWCGLLGNNTIIKLAEGYFHSSTAAFIWSFTRWIVMPLLPMVTMLTYTCTKVKTRRCCEIEDDDDVAMNEARSQ